MQNKVTSAIKDVWLFTCAFFTRWQSYAVNAPTWFAIEMWERSTGKTLDPKLWFLLMIGLFSIVSFFLMWRKQRHLINGKVGALGVMRIFDRLIMRGYEIPPTGADAWVNECANFLEKLFGKDSYQVEVFKKQKKDATVERIVIEQRAKFALMDGAKLAHPNSLKRDDGSLIFHMVVLKWAGDTFQNSHPEEKMPEEDSVGPFQTVITLVAIAAVSFGIYKTGRSHSSDNSPAAPSGAKAEIQTRHVSATLKKRLAPWLENWRKRRVPIDITASANDTETYDYSIEVKKYVESQGLKVTPIDYVVWGQGAEPHDEDAFLDPTFQTIRIGRLKKNRP